MPPRPPSRGPDADVGEASGTCPRRRAALRRAVLGAAAGLLVAGSLQRQRRSVAASLAALREPLGTVGGAATAAAAAADGGGRLLAVDASRAPRLRPAAGERLPPLSPSPTSTHEVRRPTARRIQRRNDSSGASKGSGRTDGTGAPDTTTEHGTRRPKGHTASAAPSSDDTATAPPAADRPNIVLFYADDWTARTLGLWNPAVRTPHLDALAARGVHFRRNCVTTSICWISRATMFTGTTAAVHRAVRVTDKTYLNQTLPWQETLYPQLRRAGYHTGYIGKWHNALPEEVRNATFDFWRAYFGRHWMFREGRRRHVTELNGADALDYLRSHRPPEQNFFLTVAFFATHAQDTEPFERQYEPQEYTAPLYRNATVPTPKTATEEAWRAMPSFFDDTNEGRKRWSWRYDTPERYQYTMQRYYRMATEVDDVVGAIVAELEAQGVHNNTILVFTTDNGMFHGEHGLADKWYPQEESIRVPLIVVDPRMSEQVRGTANDEFTLSVDLAPTLMAAAGIAAPPFMQGRDLAPLYLDPKGAARTWRQDFFYEWNQGDPITAADHMFWNIPAVFALIQRDYKYFYWPAYNYEQIFHVSEDPFEEFDVLNRTIQTDLSKYIELKNRYLLLKNLSQSGHLV